VSPPKDRIKENLALKEVLNKTLPERQASHEIKPIPTPTPVSLDSLKNKVGEEVKKEITYSKDRAATSEDMNKLKDLIKEKTITPVEKIEPKKEETPQNNKAREVPEDVLKKILE